MKTFFMVEVLAASFSFLLLILGMDSVLLPECPEGINKMSVMTAADADILTSSLECTGATSFVVTWVGSVIVKRSIVVSGGSSLTVTGSGWINSSAVEDQTGNTAGSSIEGSSIDGGGSVGIFIVSGGSTLALQDIVLQHGNSSRGGAISAKASNSSTGQNAISITDCLFLRNNGTSSGGEMHGKLYTEPDRNKLLNGLNKADWACYRSRSQL